MLIPLLARPKAITPWDKIAQCRWQTRRLQLLPSDRSAKLSLEKALPVNSGLRASAVGWLGSQCDQEAHESSLSRPRALSSWLATDSALAEVS